MNRCMDTPFADTNPIFETRKPFKEGFVPDTIFERDDIFDKYTRALQSIVDGFGPKNVFIFGDSGLGKTAVTNKMIEFLEYETEQKDIDLTIIKLNCNKLDNNYSLVRTIANELNEETYKQGYHKKELWDAIYTKMDETGGNYLFILDEIDQLGEDEEILYEFPRARSMEEISNAQVGIIGISNNQLYKQQLSPRVKSTLCDTEIRFDPYDANELQTILSYYADIAFKKDVVDGGVISYCAGITATESGDARFGLDLLEIAGDIARRQESNKIVEKHVNVAREELERDKIKQIYESGLTPQQKLVLLSTIFLVIERDTDVKLKSIYNKYCELCEEMNHKELTKRRVNDFCKVLTEKGLLQVNENNSGHQGGRWYSYSTLVSPKTIIDAVEECADTTSRLITSNIKQQVKMYEEKHNSKKKRQSQINRRW